MKLLLMVLCTISLIGCDSEMYQRKATYLCKDHGGLYKARLTINHITCNTGKVFTIQEVKSTIIPIHYLIQKDK